MLREDAEAARGVNQRLWLSGIHPGIKGRIHALEHLRRAALRIRELIPLRRIVVLSCAFDLRDEFLHKSQLLRVLLTQMRFAGATGLVETIFGADTHEGGIMARECGGALVFAS